VKRWLKIVTKLFRSARCSRTSQTCTTGVRWAWLAENRTWSGNVWSHANRSTTNSCTDTSGVSMPWGSTRLDPWWLQVATIDAFLSGIWKKRLMKTHMIHWYLPYWLLHWYIKCFSPVKWTNIYMFLNENKPLNFHALVNGLGAI